MLEELVVAAPLAWAETELTAAVVVAVLDIELEVFWLCVCWNASITVVPPLAEPRPFCPTLTVSPDIVRASPAVRRYSRYIWCH